MPDTAAPGPATAGAAAPGPATAGAAAPDPGAPGAGVEGLADEEERAEELAERARLAQLGGLAQWAAARQEAAAATTRALAMITARQAQEDTTPGQPGGQPTVGARRADALARLAIAALDDPNLPTRQRHRPHIGVTVAATTLLGLDDTPAHLTGYGPITAQTARRIAADGTWRRLLTDPTTGALLDYGRSTYRPPTDLADYITARDQTCQLPGCSMPAVRCDLDHIITYTAGGHTSRHNLHALCRHHHQGKTSGLWTVTLRDDGGCTWTTPAGRTYHQPPPDPLTSPAAPEPPPGPPPPQQDDDPPY